MAQARSIFTLMPFREEFDDVYMVIRDAVSAAAAESKAALVCNRADEIAKPGKITDQIIQHIIDADLIIADVTGSNPNVMYELGFAHALKKATVILNQEIHQSPFDIAGFRQILYDRTRLVKDCRPRLISAIIDVIGEGESAELESVAEELPSSTPAAGPRRGPLRPGSALVYALQRVHLKLQLPDSRRRPEALAEAAREVRDLLDRVTVSRTADPQDAANSAAVAGNCAVEFERLEMPQEAEDIYRRAIGLFPDYAGLHVQYADLLVDNGRFEEASAELARGKELAPNDPRVRRVETKMAMMTGVISDELGTSLRNAFEADPANEVAAVSYLVYLDREEVPIEEFELVCKKWEEAAEGDKKLSPRRALADRLAQSSITKDRQRSADIYEDLLRHDLGDERVPVLHNLATLYAARGDHAQAETRWREAYALDPGNAAIQASFSQLLSRRGKAGLAFKVISGDALGEADGS